MNKALFSCAALVLTLTTSSIASAQGVSGGIKAGVNFASVSGSDDDPDTRIGSMAGAFVTIGQGLLALQPEVLFSMQGSKFTFGTAKVDYFQVPVLLRIGSSAKNKASVYGLVGPTFGVRIREEGWDDPIKRSDVGATAGVGFTVSRLLVEGRFTAGLTDFSEGTTAYKHRVWSLLAGFVF